MNLILAKRLLNDPGHYFSSHTSYSCTGNTRPPKAVAEPRPSAGFGSQKRSETPSTKSESNRKRKTGGCQGGGRGEVTPACRACAVTKQRLPRGACSSGRRTLSGGRRERARGLALSRPTPLSSPPGLRLRLRDPERAPLSAPRRPALPLARVRRGGPPGEGERGGRAYVLACVSGSAHAGVRGHGEKVALAGEARFPVAM